MRTVPIVTNPTTVTAEWLGSNSYLPGGGRPACGRIGNTIVRRAGLVGALLVSGGVLAGVGTAQADPAAGPASGTAAASVPSATAAAPATEAGTADLGEAGFTQGSTTVTVPTLALCAVEGPLSATATPVSKSGLTFGGGKTTCETTVADHTTKSTADGKDFELSALADAGGPRVRMSSYTVTCAATHTQTNASWTFDGLRGITGLPSPMPANYTKPLTKPDGTALANAVFNTQTLPGDGSISITMLRFDFLPASGITGSVTVGRAGCSPTP